MITALVSTFVSIGILALLLFTPYKMAVGVMMMNNGYVDTGMKVKCAIPLVNIFVTEHELRGGIPITGITSTLTVVLGIIRVVMIFMTPTAYDAMFWTLIIFMCFMLVAYICNCQLVASILAINPILFGGEKIAKIIFYPWGQLFIGNHLATMTEQMYTKESAV